MTGRRVGPDEAGMVLPQRTRPTQRVNVVS